ncbi:hypothetical protein [Deinococcus pimensis]|uniref:hypothetical protein n=1 Tax=Deinococcus pimensis TaxID=309888 RepID=UPI00047FFE17|nr:hypothetical protein [Deinococcus pimensis]
MTRPHGHRPAITSTALLSDGPGVLGYTLDGASYALVLDERTTHRHDVPERHATTLGYGSLVQVPDDGPVSRGPASRWPSGDWPVD